MIDTERKEDLFLDTKLIKSENRLGKLRIIDELHPVLGGQPTHEKDQPNDNNPFLDLACTMQFTIDKVNAVDKKADTKLAKAQNLKDVANVAIARDNLGLGTSATMNATSTLSDRTDQTATIKAVNDVNRAASTAQKTANNAHALAQTKQDKLTFVGDGPEVMKLGAYGVGSWGVTIDADNVPISKNGFYAGSGSGSGAFRYGPFIHASRLTGERALQIGYETPGTGLRYRTFIDNSWGEVIVLYDNLNTTTDKSGFLRASGSKDAVTTDQITSTLSDRTDRVATIKVVNDVNRAANNAQTSANNANDKANTAQTRADSAYSLAQTKQDALTFVGDGPDVMKTGAFGLGRNGDRFGEEGATEYKPNGFYRIGGSDLGYPDYKRSGDASIVTSWNSSYYSELFFGQTAQRYAIKTVCNGEDLGWAELYTDKNTTPDKSGFLRASGSANALTESDRTSSLGTSTTLVASQKLVNDVNSKIKLNTASKSQNGWWKCGDTGLIYQWGTVDYDSKPAESDVSVNFPISFQYTCLNVSLTRKVLANSSTTGNDGGMLLVSAQKSNFIANRALFSSDNYQVRGFTWFAIGY